MYRESLVRGPRASPSTLGATRMTEGTDIEDTVKAALQGLGVAFEIIEIDPAYADTADFCAHYGYSLDVCGNTIIVGSKREPRQYSACVVRGSDRLDVNKAVRKLMGVSRLSFASAQETQALTGMALGGVTVFALPKGLPVYVDEKLMALDYVVLGSGSRSSKVKVSPNVFRVLPGATIVRGLALPPRTA